MRTEVPRPPQVVQGLFEKRSSRLRTDERTQAFAQRKVASGKSKLEAIRCKRYIAREVYPLVKANTADVGGSTSAP